MMRCRARSVCAATPPSVMISDDRRLRVGSSTSTADMVRPGWGSALTSDDEPAADVMCRREIPTGHSLGEPAEPRMGKAMPRSGDDARTPHTELLGEVERVPHPHERWAEIGAGVLKLEPRALEVCAPAAQRPEVHMSILAIAPPRVCAEWNGERAAERLRRCRED